MDPETEVTAFNRRWYQFSLISILIATLIVACMITLIKLNISAYESSFGNNHSWPHNVLERFLLNWIIAFVISAIAAVVIPERTVRIEAMIAAVAALVAAAVNAYYWVSVIVYI